MVLRPILEICDRETCNEGGEMRRELWWWITSARKQLSEMLEEILAASRARPWELGRRGEVRGGREVVESGVGIDGPQYSGTEIGDALVGELS